MISSFTRYVQRPEALVPLIFSIIALTLSLLCVLAGTKRGYYENVHLLTVNISMIGHVDVHLNLSTSNIFTRQLLFSDDIEEQFDDAQNLIGNLTEKSVDAVESITEQGNKALQNVINDAVNTVADKVAQALKLPDFYSAHILTYCEGYYTPSPLPNRTNPSHKNVTHCSSPTALFHFNPSHVLQSELVPGINLAGIGWPGEIEAAATAAKVASNALFVFYCFGIIMTGLALIGAILGLFMAGNLSLAVNAAFTLLAFIFLVIASAVTNITIATTVNVTNEYGKNIGVAAYRGNAFLGMTWAATAFMFLGLTAWMVIFIRRKKTAEFVHRTWRH